MKANFIEIHSGEELDELFYKSKQQPVVLFKHSLTCPISAGVYREVSGVDSDVYLIVVQYARGVSNQLAEKTGIRHESPQAIVLKDERAVYHASHYDVTANEVESYLI
jgi:bacillithiol system protein YtxJ